MSDIMFTIYGEAFQYCTYKTVVTADNTSEYIKLEKCYCPNFGKLEKVIYST